MSERYDIYAYALLPSGKRNTQRKAFIKGNVDYNEARELTEKYSIERGSSWAVPSGKECPYVNLPFSETSKFGLGFVS